MTDELHLLTKGINEFTEYLNNNLRKQNVNNIFSPICVHALFTLLSQDPWFHIKDFFNAALRLDVNIALRYHKEILAASFSDLRFANLSFFKNHCIIENDFKNLLKDNFSTELSFLDFTNKEAATEIINGWVADKTGHKVPSMCSVKDDINSIFLNTMHFENTWAEQFTTEDTTSSTFCVNWQDTIQVQMMMKKGEFYHKTLGTGTQILKLPFAGSNISLIIVLPTVDNGFVCHDLTQHTVNMTKQKVDVSLPKFQLHEVVELASSLKKIGLEDVFLANLIGIVKGEELSLTEIQQNIFCEINEQGLKVATGTSSILNKARNESILPNNVLKIYEANISTEISNRFAKTKVVWRVNNITEKAANAEFKVILTDTAFITEFFMEIGGKCYKSYIKEKEEAKNIYSSAVAQGQSAGLVEAKTRDSTEFTVSVNLEPDTVAVFSLTYEELLQRLHDQYELVLNICPGQIVEDLTVEVRINESRPLKFVNTPPLRSGNDIRTKTFDNYLEPLSDIKFINSKTASIKFRPDPATQKRMGHYLGKNPKEGLSGQFVVQYDVEREPTNGEVLLQDGYFVHFFAPNDLEPLPKHVIFVLDTSGSMGGRKIEQLKDAMMNILDELGKEDMLSIIEFNNDVVLWDVNSKKLALLSEKMIKDFRDPFTSLQRYILADPQRVSDDIVIKAKVVVKDMMVNGRTFMIGGLETALYLVKVGKQLNEKKDVKLQPVIIFLTDGEPNVGISSKDQIIDLVTHLNTNEKVPIFSLSFGNEADKNFLRKLSLKNLGFSRHIYEASDASLQLQDFYKSISSPLLNNVEFKYDAEVAEVTKTWFPIFFKGSELIVSGRYGGPVFPTVINCWGPHGLITVGSVTEKPVTSLERLWAYLAVKQLLDERDKMENRAELTRKAISIALKYSFVTDVTSLVVVKPNETVPTFGRNEFVIPKSFGVASGQSIFGKFETLQSGFGNIGATGTLFGSSPATGTTFESSPATVIAFGSSPATGIAFGSSPATVTTFGSSSATGTTFGSSPATGIAFGSSPATVTTFGSSSAFGTSIGKSQGFGAPFGSTRGASGLFGASAGFTSGGFGVTTGSNQSNLGSIQANQTSFGNSPANQWSFGNIQTNQLVSGNTPHFFGQSQGNQLNFGNFTANQSNSGNFTATSGIFGNTTNAETLGTSTGNFKFGLHLTDSRLGTTSNDQEEDVKKFVANRPFYVILQLENNGTAVVLLRGYISRPKC